jgi:hypothetical protein
MITASLSEWLRWVADMPAAFRGVPEGFPGGTVRVRAVVADVLESLFGQAPDDAFLRVCDGHDSSKAERNRLAWILAAMHLLWHPILRADLRMQPGQRAALERFVVQELASVAAVVPIDDLTSDEDRREELVRRLLRAAGMGLSGESAREAEDRMKQVDSVERHRVLSQAAERERRGRKVREAMARKAAEEAAAKVSRE